MNNSNINPNKQMISGPVNVVRLEGNVHDIKKVIYLFMDYHIDVKNQTQCANVFSQDVQKYFANSFYKLNKGTQTYDFFLEVYPTELGGRKQNLNESVDYKNMYIEEVVKFFRRIFVHNPKKNIVTINKLFKNVRLHYLDIRDYYKTNIYEQVSQMKSLARSFVINDYINIDKLGKIINLLQIMKRHLNFIIEVLSENITEIPKPDKIIRPTTHALDVDTLYYLANKIKEKYKYKNVQKEMNRLLHERLNNFRDTIVDVDEAIKRFNEYLDYMYESGDKLQRDNNSLYLFSYGPSIYTIRNMIVDIINTVDKLVDDQFVEYFARFTDVYFLRRFLDKDYITNAIEYSGALHSMTYIYELIKTFNFKITHTSYSKINDMDKLTNEIKKRSLMEIQELILPPNLQQCSDMTHFPEKFM